MSKTQNSSNQKLAQGFLKSLCPCKKFYKRKDHQLYMQKATQKKYSEACDIVNLINITLNLRILLNALFTKQ